jgi:hypothetical protein
MVSGFVPKGRAPPHCDTTCRAPLMLLAPDTPSRRKSRRLAHVRDNLIERVPLRAWRGAHAENHCQALCPHCSSPGFSVLTWPLYIHRTVFVAHLANSCLLQAPSTISPEKARWADCGCHRAEMLASVGRRLTPSPSLASRFQLLFPVAAQYERSLASS